MNLIKTLLKSDGFRSVSLSSQARINFKTKTFKTVLNDKVKFDVQLIKFSVTEDRKCSQKCVENDSNISNA